jgi:hypothetical protein
MTPSPWSILRRDLPTCTACGRRVRPDEEFRLRGMVFHRRCSGYQGRPPAKS